MLVNLCKYYSKQFADANNLFETARRKTFAVCDDGDPTVM